MPQVQAVANKPGKDHRAQGQKFMCQTVRSRDHYQHESRQYGYQRQHGRVWNTFIKPDQTNKQHNQGAVFECVSRR